MPAPAPTWRLLPPVLLAAFLARAALALATDSVSHPDEVFQYLEQGHRLAFGYGHVPWEYRYGIRSWLVAGFIAGLLKLAAGVGLDYPGSYIPLVKLVFCAISLCLPWSMYHLARRVAGENAARIALVFGAFWYELLYYAHKPMPDALATYAIIAAMALLVATPGLRNRLAFGALAGLVLVLRFQLLPVVGVLCLASMWQWRWKAVPAAAAFLLVLATAGALDAYTWGYWFSSILLNIQMNVVVGVANAFGTQPFYYYLGTLMISSLGLVGLGAVGLVALARRHALLLLVAAVDLLAFSLVGHKEPRFVLALVPLYLVGLAALVADGGVLLGQSLPSLRPQARLWAQGLVAGCLIVSAAGVFDLLPIENRVYLTPVLIREDDFQAFLYLSRQKDVHGVYDDRGDNLYNTGGYYYLHLDTPLYIENVPAGALALVKANPAAYASHWITPGAAAQPAGYRLLTRTGELSIWRRDSDPVSMPPAPGYEAKMLVELKGPPVVTPRW